MFCVICGKENSEDNHFCTNCGNPLEIEKDYRELIKSTGSTTPQDELDALFSEEEETEEVQELKEEIKELKQEAYDKERGLGDGLKALGLVIVGYFGLYFFLTLLISWFS